MGTVIKIGKGIIVSMIFNWLRFRSPSMACSIGLSKICKPLAVSLIPPHHPLELLEPLHLLACTGEDAEDIESDLQRNSQQLSSFLSSGEIFCLR